MDSEEGKLPEFWDYGSSEIPLETQVISNLQFDGSEMCLDWLVERKTWSDLNQSIIGKDVSSFFVNKTSISSFPWPFSRL